MIFATDRWMAHVCMFYHLIRVRHVYNGRWFSKWLAIVAHRKRVHPIQLISDGGCVRMHNAMILKSLVLPHTFVLNSTDVHFRSIFDILLPSTVLEQWQERERERGGGEDGDRTSQSMANHHIPFFQHVSCKNVHILYYEFIQFTLKPEALLCMECIIRPLHSSQVTTAQIPFV